MYIFFFTLYILPVHYVCTYFVYPKYVHKIFYMDKILGMKMSMKMNVLYVHIICTYFGKYNMYI